MPFERHAVSSRVGRIEPEFRPTLRGIGARVAPPEAISEVAEAVAAKIDMQRERATDTLLGAPQPGSDAWQQEWAARDTDAGRAELARWAFEVEPPEHRLLSCSFQPWALSVRCTASVDTDDAGADEPWARWCV